MLESMKTSIPHHFPDDVAKPGTAVTRFRVRLTNPDRARPENLKLCHAGFLSVSAFQGCRRASDREKKSAREKAGK